MAVRSLLLCLLISVVCCGTDGQNTTSTPANSPSNSTAASTHAGTEDTEFTNRLAQARLFHLWNLQRHVLSSLGWNSTPASLDPATRQRLLQDINPAAFVTLRDNCYYPLCDLSTAHLPDYMNRTIWFDNCSRSARFYFNIPANDDPGQEITSAVVKLHLKRRQDCSCAFEDDQINGRIHIKIYQYRKPIRSQARLRHSNMRLIDAKMVTWDSSRWVTLQVTDAVRRIARGKRNAGFEVQIKNMDEEVLDAKSILDPTVCSATTEYECTESAETEYEESVANFSPVLVIRNRISVNSQGFLDNR